MKLSIRIAASLLTLGLIAPAIAQYGPQYRPPPPPPPEYGFHGWEAPPGELRDFQRRGYLDGVQGAQRDYENHRIWNVDNRDEFRHPHVPGNVRGDYRDGFKRGYYAGVSHFQGVR